MARKKKKVQKISPKEREGVSVFTYSKNLQNRNVPRNVSQDLYLMHPMVKSLIEKRKLLLERMDIILRMNTKIPTDIFERDSRIIFLMIHRLEDFDINTTVDTRAIDMALYDLCEELDIAYKRKDILTARYIIQAFSFGVMVGHKALLSDELNNDVAIVQEREEELERYLIMCKISRYYFQYKFERNGIVQKMKEQLEEIEELKIWLWNKEINAAAQYAEAMQKLGVSKGNLEALQGFDFEVASMMFKMCRRIKMCNLLHKQLILTMYDCQYYFSTLEECKIGFEKINRYVKEEFVKYENELMGEFSCKTQYTDLIRDPNFQWKSISDMLDNLYAEILISESNSQVEVVTNQLEGIRLQWKRMLEKYNISIEALEEYE